MSTFYGWSIGITQIDDSIVPLNDGAYNLGSATRMFKNLFLCSSILLDTDNTEALLIRKHGDSGDLFAADTVNMRVDVTGDIGVTGDLTLSKWAGLGTGKVRVDNDGTIFAE